MFECMHLWCVGTNTSITHVSHLNPGVQLWEINSSIKEEEKEKGEMRGRRRQSLRRMIGAVTVRDNSTGGKKVELKAAKARWRFGSGGVMIAHLMSASVTETTWKFKD